MNNHSIRVVIDDQHDYQFQTKDVEGPHFFEICGYKFAYRDRMVYWIDEAGKEQPVYAWNNRLQPQEQTLTDLGDNHHAVAHVERIYDKRVHPKGRVCGQCIHFDHPAGRTLLEKGTHKFANGGYGFTDIVTQYTAKEAKSPTFNTESVGFCPYNEGQLVDRRSPACVEHFERPPLLKRIFGKKGA